MGLFDSAEERERKKKLKQEEKERKKRLKEEEEERKRQIFERIMASNPEVTPKTPEQKEREKREQMKKKTTVSFSSSTCTVKKDNIARCPKCGSTSLTANKKGFSLAKGVAGVFVAGAIGVVAAGHGKDKVIITCLNCGHQWKAGKK